MEHHNSSTHYLMWKVQSEFPTATATAMNSFRPPPFIHESLVWPPRSYPCSFCRREFRSAQALGGHMNVHRRDRAKLKQSSPPPPKTTLTPPPLTPPPLMNCGGGEESGRRSCEDNFGDSDVVCKRHKLMCFPAIEEIDLELRLGAPVGHIS